MFCRCVLSVRKPAEFRWNRDDEVAGPMHVTVARDLAHGLVGLDITRFRLSTLMGPAKAARLGLVGATWYDAAVVDASTEGTIRKDVAETHPAQVVAVAPTTFRGLVLASLH